MEQVTCGAAFSGEGSLSTSSQSSSTFFTDGRPSALTATGSSKRPSITLKTTAQRKPRRRAKRTDAFHIGIPLRVGSRTRQPPGSKNGHERSRSNDQPLERLWKIFSTFQ